MSVADLLVRRRDEVEQQLAQATGDASLCAISRSGGRVDGVKHLEGRMASLMELLRAIRRGAEPVPTAQALLAEWEQALATAKEGWGPSWVAYRAGGVDELTQVVAELTGDQP